METGKFYFIKDKYYEKFKDCGLMENKGENFGQKWDKFVHYFPNKNLANANE